MSFRTVIFGTAIALAACAPASDRPDVPTPPTPPGDVMAPAAPSAGEIMRISDIDFTSYSRDIAKFVGLELGEDFLVSKSKMETYFVPGKGTSENAVANERREGPAEAAFSTFGAEGGTVIVADRFNMADDSVKAEQMYAISKKKADGSEMLVDFGMKLKCWRGEDPDAWGTDLCP